MKHLLTILAYLLLCYQSYGQEIPKNLIYGNENLQFERIYKVGSHTLLLHVPNRQNKRVLYLLNEQNLVSDQIKVQGNDDFLIRSKSSFALSGLSEYVEFKIENDSLVPLFGFQSKANFSQILSPEFVINNTIVGTKWNADYDCSPYYYMPISKVKALVSLNPKVEEYAFNRLDTVFLFDAQGIEQIEKGTIDRFEIKALTMLNDCDNRMPYPYYGWRNFTYSEDLLTIYDMKIGALFIIQFDQEGKPGVQKKIPLPINRGTSGWKHLYDKTQNKHYFAERIETIPDTKGLNKRQIRKLEPTISYKLYELSLDTEILKPLYKLGFSPELIDNALIYEIVSAPKKGSSIYFHPLDSNYIYQKSTLIYSN
ncbi:hypothetical protein [Roseivirga pacifica]|uniref:hypothetical protein n=1 Tax=Roseivirga pacifica TaxID=1267423 RepID=UPI00227BB471|nr:hypothetical protein [Roseivirga pacifica]